MTATHTFTWTGEAQEVFVTGTFDNWKKTVQLEKNGKTFSKEVELPVEDVEYKFVIDGVWQIDATAAINEDDEGNKNNFIPKNVLAPVATATTGSDHIPAVPSEPLATREQQPHLQMSEDTIVKSEQAAEKPAQQPGVAEQQAEQLEQKVEGKVAEAGPAETKPAEPTPEPATESVKESATETTMETVTDTATETTTEDKEAGIKGVVDAVKDGAEVVKKHKALFKKIKALFK